MARQPQKRGGDVTGRNSERLAAEKAAELEARQQEISLINAKARAVDDEVVDLTSEDVINEPPVVQEADQDKYQPVAAKPQDVGPGAEEIQVQEVEVAEPVREFRVNEDLENVTIGQGNNYNFYEGKKYRAPKHVYDHLDEKGYVWH